MKVCFIYRLFADLLPKSPTFAAMKYLLVFTFLITGLTVQSQLIYDESYLDASFWQFKSTLTSSIIARDTTQLKTMLADHVFDSEHGCGYPGCSPSQLIKTYFSKPEATGWQEMTNILRFGMKRLTSPRRLEGEETWEAAFQGPSYLSTINNETEALILGESVNIRNKPGLKSQVIRQASYEKFTCDCSIETQTATTYQHIDGLTWLEIKWGKGQLGYVASKLTSYEKMRELTIAKIEGKWKIVSFFLPSGC